MSFSVETTHDFRHQAKKLLKKYPSLRAELKQLQEDLMNTPIMGKALENNTYKIRLAVKSKGKGKSGGLRIINYVVTKKELIFLIAIYDKSEMATIQDKTIKAYTKDIDDLLL